MTKLVAPHFEHNPDSYRLRVGKLGLFDRFGTGIAGEQPAFYPRLANNRGGRIAMSRMIYGYTTQIAPLYTCALYNAIANDGAFCASQVGKRPKDIRWPGFNNCSELRPGKYMFASKCQEIALYA